MTNARQVNHPVWFFFSSIFLSFLLIFVFLCLSVHAENISGPKVFDYTGSPNIIFAPASVIEKSAPKEKLRAKEFRKLNGNAIKGYRKSTQKKSTKVVLNDHDGLGVFFTASAVGVKWNNKW